MTGVAANTKTWFTARELADLDLPGLSPRRNRVVEIAAAQRWAEQFDAAGQPLFRQRSGRGGGFEYHHTLLPVPAVRALAEKGLIDAPEAAANDDLTAPNDDLGALFDWAWYEAQTERVKADAEARLKAVMAVETGRAAGLGQNAAVSVTARDHGVSAATLWNWLALVKGVPAADRLPALAPRRKGGGVQAGIDARLMTYFKSYRCRPGPQGFAESWHQTVKHAATLGISKAEVPGIKAFTRQLRREVPAEVFDALVKGMDAVVAATPAQKRDRSMFTALQALNIDGHKWDIFVRMPDGKVGRPISVVLQDLYSNKIVAWRTGDSESALMTRLCFGDLIRKYGIPEHLTLDNGRAFASKWLTGGVKNRFRFKVRDGEPLGLLTQLGVNIHWAQPYHGQSKPIERVFRTVETILSGHPSAHGAWTGKSTEKKPHNYGEAVMGWEEFQQLTAWAVAEYNAREGRQGANARGKSYDQVFEASYRTQPVRRATEEQLRLCLLTGEQVRLHSKTAALSLYGNTFYAQAMYPLAGKTVTVRFDPDNLQKEVHVYRETGEFLCTAELQAAVGFYDVQGAKDRAKLNANLRKATREAIRLQGLASAADLAAMTPFETPEQPVPEPTVIRPVRTRGASPARATAPALQEFRESFSAAMQASERAPRIERFKVFEGGATPRSRPEGQ